MLQAHATQATVGIFQRQRFDGRVQVMENVNEGLYRCSGLASEGPDRACT